MSYNVDAIFDHGVFRPLQPVSYPEGARVHLSVTQMPESGGRVDRLMSPKLANPEQSTDFVLEIVESSDAGL
jgi:predicted DNA-binding antitoxin AbrB/MazE fold protein